MNRGMWVVVIGGGLLVLVLLIWNAHRLMLKAEAKGWIYYRKAGGGRITSGLGDAMAEIERVVRPAAVYRLEAKDLSSQQAESTERDVETRLETESNRCEDKS